MTNEIFISTTTQRILAYLAIHSAEEFTEKEISRRTGVKKSATNLALRNLVRTDLISRRKIGRSSLFKADISENLIREIKVLITKEKLSPLVKKLKKTSKKIALFGSAAAGTNTKDSDIDLLILSPSFAKMTTDKRFDLLYTSRTSPLTQNVAMDIFGLTPKEYNQASNLSIVGEIKENGREVFPQV